MPWKKSLSSLLAGSLNWRAAARSPQRPPSLSACLWSCCAWGQGSTPPEQGLTHPRHTFQAPKVSQKRSPFPGNSSLKSLSVSLSGADSPTSLLRNQHIFWHPVWGEREEVELQFFLKHLCIGVQKTPDHHDAWCIHMGVVLYPVSISTHGELFVHHDGLLKATERNQNCFVNMPC